MIHKLGYISKEKFMGGDASITKDMRPTAIDAAGYAIEGWDG